MGNHKSDLQQSKELFEIDLLTIKEVAELLRISGSLVRRLQQNRRIPFIKVGGSIRFNKRDVAEYLRQRTIEKMG